METKTVTNLYPTISLPHIQNPNRFYAFFVIGFVTKIIMLIPVFIELVFLGIAAFVMVMLINPLVVLFTGKYWDPAYTLMSGIMKLSAKISLFLFGLTNTYPGFDFTIHDKYTIDIPKPQHPNRFFAIPVLGGVARIVLLIPFLIYETVIRNGASIGATASSFPALFKGKYPESTYEIERDSVRLNLAISMYMAGFSDKYPNFWISMNHQPIKILLIILGALMVLGNWGNTAMNPNRQEYDQTQYDRNYDDMMQNYNEMAPSAAIEQYDTTQ